MVYITFVLTYLILLIGVGAWFSRRVKSQADFVVAGRQLSAFVLVGTLLATWTGSGSLFNNGRLAYENGYAALWSAAGSWLGIMVIFFVVYKIRSTNKLSIPDILEERFDHRVGMIATLITLVAYVTIVSYQFKGGGRVVNLLAGEDFSFWGMSAETTGMVVVALFAITYTVLAGMLSVTYTDVVNGVVMLVGIAIAIPFALDKVGGVEGVVNVIPMDSERWTLFGTMGWKKALAYFLPTMFLLMGDANMYQRLLGAKTANVAKKAVIGWIIGVIIIEILIVTLSFIGSALEPGIATMANKDKSNEMKAGIVLLVAYRHVPTFVGCLLLASIMAIIISTADSFLLVPATNLSHDVYHKHIRPDASQQELIWVSRGAVLFLGLMAFAMIKFYKEILEAAYAAYTIYGASITPVLLAAFLWKRATTNGALLALISGAGVTIICEIYKKWYPKTFFAKEVDTIFPALAISVTMLIVGSLFLSKKTDNSTESST